MTKGFVPMRRLLPLSSLLMILSNLKELSAFEDFMKALNTRSSTSPTPEIQPL
jgi:hypothetical protein